MANFFLDNLDYVFFVYGFSFIILATVTYSLRKVPAERLRWGWLGLFALIHGVNEWLDMLALGLEYSPLFSAVRTLIMALSFACLAPFAFQLEDRGTRLFVAGWVGTVLAAICLLMSGGFEAHGNALARYLLALPLGFCCTGALWREGTSKEGREASTLKVAAVVFVVYAIAAGFVVSPTDLFLAGKINTRAFLSLFDFPVQVVRAGCAVLIAGFIYQYLLARNRKLFPWSPRWASRSLNWGLWVALAIVLVIGAIVVEQVGRVADRSEHLKLLVVAKVSTTAIDSDLLMALSGVTADTETPQYAELRRILVVLAEQVPEIKLRWNYLMIRRNGQILFLVDSIDEKSPVHTAPGMLYDDAPHELHQVFSSAKEAVIGPYTDRWGTFISAFVPIIGPNGRVEAVFGVDMNAGEHARIVASQRIEPILIVMLIAVLLLIFFVYLESARDRAEPLIASERDLRNIYESSPNAIFLLDESKRIVSINRSGAKEFGQGENDYLGIEFSTLWKPDCWSAIDVALEQARLLERRTIDAESLSKSPENEHWTLTISTIAEGELNSRQWIVIAVNISGRIFAETRLKDKLEQVKTLLATIPNPIFFKDEKGKYLGCNRAWEQVFGLKEEDMIGKTVFDMYPKEMAERFYEADQELFKFGGVQRYEAEVLDAAKWKRQVLFHKTVFSDQDGNVAGLVGVVLDMTDFRLIEAERERLLTTVQRDSDLFATVIKSMSEEVWRCDVDGNVELLNQSASSGIPLIGWNESAEETESSARQFEFLRSDGVIRSIEEMPLFRALKGESSQGCEEIARDLTTGQLFYRIVSAAPQYDRQANIVGAVSIVRDVTEARLGTEALRSSEEQLRQSKRMEAIGRLAAGVANEINTPSQFLNDNMIFLQHSCAELLEIVKAVRGLHLGSVKGDASVEGVEQVRSACRSVNFDYLLHEIPRALNGSLDGAQRISRIVSAMQEFAQSGSEERHPYNLNKAIQDTLTVSHNEYKYVADVEMSLAPDLPRPLCLQGDMNQVLFNLVVNAAQAIEAAVGIDSGRRGRITIATCCDGAWLEARIADNGIGISDAVRESIFDPFFSTKDTSRKLGRGLAMCHSVVVTKHQGTITFDTAVGVGTTFVVRLPVNNSPLLT